jgi:flagellar protein FliS
MQQHVNAYQKSQSLTARRGDLLLSLFDGALRFCEEAKVAIEDNQPEAKGRAVGRTMAIFDELTRSLDRTQAPELCDEIANIYHYLERRLQVAGHEMQSSPINEVVSHLTMLRGTWARAVDSARQEGHQV